MSMGITPNTTLAEIAASEKMQRELAEVILGNGARAAMASRRIGYNSADAVAEGIRRGITDGTERLVERHRGTA